MNIETLLQLAKFGAALYEAGVATYDQIKTALYASHPGLTDAEMNQILQWVIDDASRRKAQRDLDAAPATQEPPAAGTVSPSPAVPSPAIPS